MAQTGVGARLFNVAVGIWLFFSAFIWPHTPAQMLDTALVGLAIVLIAALGTGIPRLRYANTALAVWLFVSAWVLPTRSSGTFLNDVIVALAVFIVSLIPGRTVTRFPSQPEPTA